MTRLSSAEHMGTLGCYSRLVFTDMMQQAGLTPASSYWTGAATPCLLIIPWLLVVWDNQNL